MEAPVLHGKAGEIKSQNKSRFLKEYCVPCFCFQEVLFNMEFSLVLQKVISNLSLLVHSEKRPHKTDKTVFLESDRMFEGLHVLTSIREAPFLFYFFFIFQVVLVEKKSSQGFC